MQQHITTVGGNTVRAVLFDSQRETRESCGRNQRAWNTKWIGITEDRAYRNFETGDNEMVTPSDEMISKLEDKIEFRTSRYRTFDDVAGGVPNVPAMLANQPLNMRVRRKVMDDMGPLTIVIDLTSSAGIKESYLVKRGSAILALSRILSGIRPVNIWLGCGLSGGENTSGGSTAWFRLDASPLDLSRAAFQMSSAGVSRGMLYSYLRKTWGCGGSWPLYNCDAWRRVAPKFLSQWFDGEILFIPPVFQTDEFEVPEVWLEKMVAAYGGRRED